MAATARLPLHAFDPVSLVAAREALAVIEAHAPGAPTVVPWKVGSLTAEILVVGGEGGWSLVGSPDTQLNRCGTDMFPRLRHGDVVSVGPLHVMVSDERAQLPRFPSLESAIIASRGDLTLLSVLNDQLLESSPSDAQQDRLGEIHSLLGRGLDVTYASGFVDGARLTLEAPMMRRWSRRWLRLLAVEPGLQFVRSLELVANEGFDSQVGIVLADLTRWLRSSARPLLRSIVLSHAFSSADELRALAECVDEVIVREEELPIAPVEIVVPDNDEVRLFDQPRASSWGW